MRSTLQSQINPETVRRQSKPTNQHLIPMNRIILTLAATAIVTPLASFGQTTIFSDDFSSSTVNVTPGTPTATSTGYITASSKNAPASSMSAGHYTINQAATSSAFMETQARFGSSPVSLSTVGNYINMMVVFTDTSGILASGKANSTLNVGLFNSDGVNPLTGLNSSGLSGATTFNRGGAQLWQGYMGRIFQSGTSGIYLRNQQNAVTDSTGNDNNGNQDLLFDGAGTGTYKNPTGAALGTVAAPDVALAQGNQYTINYRLTLSAADTITIAYDLYDGVGTGGTSLFGESVDAAGANILTTSVDGLAIGYRYAGVTGDPASSIDLNSIIITTTAMVPEPGTLALAGLGMLGMVGMYRRQRR